MRRLSFADWGGTEQVVWNIAKSQANAGHDVRIFATTALCPQTSELRDGLHISRFSPVYPWWPMTKRTIARLDCKGGNPFVPGLARELLSWHPDVIHCHAMGRIAELCLRTAKRCGAKSAISLHGGGALVPDDEARELRSPTRHLLPWGKLLEVALRWNRNIPLDFDGIVCVGEDEADYWCTRHSKVLFLPNGVDTSLFADAEAGKCPEDADGTPSQDDAAQRKTILCVARIDRQKNQTMLIDALARHPNLRLRLVGPVTQPDYRSELEALANRLGVEDRVAFVGPLDPASDALIAEYRNADAFALASRHEPFGIVVLEAWAAGLPVLASNVGGLARLCARHPGASLVFDSSDAADLDAALSALFEKPDSPNLRSTLSKAGREAATHYDWHNLALILTAWY